MIARNFRSEIYLFCAGLFLACHTVIGQEPKKEADAKANLVAPLSGRVIDDLGKPVAGARLTLTRERFHRTKTDKDGKYAFAGITEPGAYRLSIQSNRCVDITAYSKQPTMGLDPNKPIAKDFELQRACRIKVLVVDEKGMPVSSARLTCRPTGGEDVEPSDDVNTGEDGTGLIEGLLPSKAAYFVTAKANGFAQSFQAVLANDPEKGSETKIVLKEGKTIRGKSVCTDGHPPAGWRIFATPAWDKSDRYAEGSKIAEDGSFEINDVGEGPHKLTIAISIGESGRRYATVMSDTDLQKMEQPISVKLDYPSPQSMTYLECEIRWIGKPLKRGFQLNGYCADLQHHVFQFVSTKDGNNVKLGPMPAGVYRIRPESSQLEVMNLRGIKNLNDLNQVKVPADKPLQLVLRVKGKPHVQAKVVDAETKKPVQDFKFRINKIRTLSGPNYVPGDEWEVAKTKTGEIQEDVSGPGIYYVSVLAEGYAVAHTKQVNTDETPDKVLEIELQRGVSLEGRVVDKDGNGVEGAKVRALSLAKGAHSGVSNEFVSDVGQVVTNQDGKFRFKHLNEGYEWFRVDHPDYVYTRVSYKLGETPNSSVFDSTDYSSPFEIKLKKGATIQGKVFDNFGKPVIGETIFFQDNNGYSGGGDEEAGRFGTASTDQNGFYQVENIPERTVYVMRNDPWEVNGVARHVVFAKEGQTHNLDFGGKTKLSGTYKISGEPLENTRLQLTGNDPMFGAMKMYCRTNEQGEFDFHGAPSGHWTLYREIEGMRGEFVKVRDVDVPANADLDLGSIEHSVGTLVVTYKSNSGILPKGLGMDFQQYNPRYRFGRTAAKLMARADPNDPFAFTQVSPGDFAIVLRGTKFGFYKPITITEETIDQEIELEGPEGKATVKVFLRNKNDEAYGGTLMLSSEDRTMYARMTMQKSEDENYSELTGVPDGKYVVHPAYFGDAGALATLEVVDGKDVTIRQQIPEIVRPAVVNVTVMDEQGVFVPCEFQLSGEKADQLSQRVNRIKRDVVGPADIQYSLKIEHPGYETHIEKVTQKAGTDIYVVLKDSP